MVDVRNGHLATEDEEVIMNTVRALSNTWNLFADKSTVDFFGDDKIFAREDTCLLIEKIHLHYSVNNIWLAIFLDCTTIEGQVRSKSLLIKVKRKKKK